MDPLPIRLPLLMDGAMGTQLQQHGMPLGVCTEAWVMDHPQALKAVQTAYVEAGAQVLVTPTMSANPEMLKHFGFLDRLEEMNTTLTQWTRENAGPGVLVAGNLGPTGHAIPPYGETPFEVLVGAYAQQAQVLDKAGVDLFLMEGVMTMAEARAAVLGIREGGSEKPIFVTCFCDEEGRTPAGVDVLACAIVMQGMGVAAFGLNCVEVAVAAEQLARIREHLDIPLIVQPSAGLPITTTEGTIVYEDHPGEFAQYCALWAQAGVRVFGSCCGTHAGHIAAMKMALGDIDFSAYHTPERDPDVIPCASEKEARFVTPDVDWGDPIPCSSDLVEDILEAENESPTGALQIEIMDEDDLHMFAEEQYAIQDPLSIWCDVPELMEAALRAYQGRAIYDSTSELEEEVVAQLVKKYGLIVL